MQFLLNKYLLIIMVFFACASCEEPINMEFNEEQTLEIVIEGLLTDNLESFKVKLTQPVLDPQDNPMPIKGAIVYIDFNDTKIALLESTSEAGWYVSENNYRAVVNTNYSLSVTYNNKEYTATTSMIPITPFSALSYREVKEGMFFLENTFNSTENALWKVEYDWDKFGNCDTCYATTYLYTLHSLNTSQIFDRSNQNITVPLLTNITVTKYSLTQEHADFYRDLLMETRWDGSILGEASGQVQGNVSEGAVGYFGASAVLSKSFVIARQGQ